MRSFVIVLPLTLLSACATLVTGTSQTLTVSTTPAGASCTLDRVGERIGAVSPTPGSVRIDKSKNDLSVTCSKEGFQTASATHTSSFNGATFGNVIAGGVIGIVVDASSGANFSYPADIRLELAPMPAQPVPVAERPATPAATPVRLQRVSRSGKAGSAPVRAARVASAEPGVR